MNNIYENIPSSLPKELFTVLSQGKDVKVERIVSRGQITPKGSWYDQDKDEWVVLLTGAARLRIDGRKELVTLGPGDSILLPAHLKHRVEWTDPNKDSIWLAVHFTASAP